MNTSSRSILVVEDHPIFRRFLLSWLSRSYQVTAVSDGLEALRWLQDGHHVDLIMLDMEMPRISGLQFLRNIRASGMFRSIPVIGLSSSFDEQVEVKCRRLGVEHMFPKPYQPHALLEAIDHQLSKTSLSLAA